jgi:transcription elongation factor GreA
VAKGLAMPDTIPMTPRGYQMMKDKLHQLKTVERPKVVKEIEYARELGDLSENFEYHAAKDRQGMIEAQIKDLDGRLSLAEVIDPSKLSGDRVVFGATVELLDLDTDAEMKYQIVGEIEADIKSGLLSVSSPIARALIGKEVGDEVQIKTPGGLRSVEIMDVLFQ